MPCRDALGCKAVMMLCRAVLQDWAREARTSRGARAKSVASRAAALLFRCHASCTLAVIFTAWLARMRHNSFALSAIAASSLARERVLRRSTFGAWAWSVTFEVSDGDAGSLFVWGAPTVESLVQLVRERTLRESTLQAWKRLVTWEASERLSDAASSFVWGAPASSCAASSCAASSVEARKRGARPWRSWAGTAQPIILRSLFPNTMRRRCEKRATAAAASHTTGHTDMAAAPQVGLKQTLCSRSGSEELTGHDRSRLESIASKLASSDLFQQTPSIAGGTDERGCAVERSALRDEVAKVLQQSGVFGQDDVGFLDLARLESLTVPDEDGLEERSTFELLGFSGTPSFR